MTFFDFKKLKFDIPDGLENVKMVGPLGIRRIEKEKRQSQSDQ